MSARIMQSNYLEQNWLQNFTVLSQEAHKNSYGWRFFDLPRKVEAVQLLEFPTKRNVNLYVNMSL